MNDLKCESPRRLFTAVLIAGLLAVLALLPLSLAANPGPPTKQAVISVKGLACPFCVHGLKKHLARLEGAKKVEVSLKRGRAVVTFDARSKVTIKQIERAVRKAGFTPGEVRWRTAADDETKSGSQ
ncbi:MAG TPA: heavy-metal-associated domain-containing protein [Thermoanaerobaculia bacterium]|nr:heavy-metal-associated domain-containing protein [Thermoanaerobaculia bacterium]